MKQKLNFQPIIFSILFLLMSIGVNAQTHVRLTNLPHIYINTADGKSIQSKTTYVLCKMWYVDEEDQVTEYDSVQIRGRGNSTWNMAKKPYRIKFPSKQKFLGKGYAKAKNWTLLANCGDKTLMRNAITSEMGKWLGLKFNPAAKFVDLTLNGVYQGNYQISDQVDVRPHRVNITEQDLPLTEESDITGGYLLEVDGFNDGNHFTTSRGGVPIRIHYPDDEDIVAEQNNYIRTYMKNFESVLFGNDYLDPHIGYRAWVDSTSLVNWFIATEVSANIDGYFSTYFYKDQQDSLLYWGPLWDYDIAYDNDQRISGNTRKLMTDVGYGQTKVWLNRMWNDAWFCNLVYTRYQQAVRDGLEAFMMQKIDSISDLLQESQQLNYQKWGISKRMYHEVVLYSSYDEYVQYVKDFITAHMAFLEEEFASRKPKEPTPPFKPEGYYYRISNKGTSTVFDIRQTDTIDYSEKHLPVEGAKVVGWENLSERLSQDWRITPVGNVFFIQNRLGNLALSDPTEDPVTATTNVGGDITLALPDSTDDHQLWIITPQGSDGYYNLTNVHTQHTTNLNGGGWSNGTHIVSYTTDERNSSSNNRLWRLLASSKLPVDSIPVDTIPLDTVPTDTIPIDTIPVDTIPIDTIPTDTIPDDPDVPPVDICNVPEPMAYVLAYNPVLQQLHFAAEEPKELIFNAIIYTSDGRRLRSFSSAIPHSVADLPRSTYLVRWYVGGRWRSTKFVK